MNFIKYSDESLLQYVLCTIVRTFIPSAGSEEGTSKSPEKLFLGIGIAFAAPFHNNFDALVVLLLM